MKIKKRRRGKIQGQPRKMAVAIGTGFGAGYWPWGAGTAGALLATLIWIALSYMFTPLCLLILTTILVVAFTALGVWATNRLEPHWGEDPSRVVVDEMVGAWIALLVAKPFVWWHAWAAFTLFRFFDMAKPLGIRRMESIPGGWGVMMDDVLAGVYSAMVLFVIECLT